MSQPEITHEKRTKPYKYYDFIMAAFVTVLIGSNMIGPAKICDVAGFTFGAGILFFPISYVFGDILTEVYGYAYSRKVVWAGIAGLIFISLMSWVVVNMPPAAGWPHQAAYETVFGATPRIVFASITAYFCGEFANSFTLAKMKIFSKGKGLWKRTIGSTAVGEGVDSLVFYPLAFLGVWSVSQVVTVMVTNYILKVLVEVAMTPVTYRVVAFLKKAEHEDYYDHNTNFTPFSLKTRQ